MKEAIIKAFPISIPVLLGYVPLGIAFGIMMAHAGYGVVWAFGSSLFIYTGTGQFMEVGFLSTAAPLLEVALVMLVLNSRMMFYGLSFLEKFDSMGGLKWYMIFSLTDETYALLCAVKCPDGVDEKRFMLALSGMNQLYWISGGVIGVLAGSVIPFDITGIDFIMTALFVVLAMDQWKVYRSHEPAIIGLLSSLVMLAILGPDNFMIPALLVIIAGLIIRRRRIEGA
jgi:4-azaleucine resistance transporter AzlC